MTGGVLALVAARGGSKGLPRKNVVPLDGHPLIAWSIAAGAASEAVDRIVCSTDDEEIAEAARRYGADVPFRRPAPLAADDTPDLPVFAHVLRWLKDVEGWEPDLIVHLRPTTPLRRPGEIDRAIDLLRADPDATSCRSVCPPPHTPYKMWRRDDGPYLAPLLEVEGIAEPYNEPRQRLPAVLWHPGVLDVVRSSTLLRGSMTGERILPLEIDPVYAVDIDGPEDLERAVIRLRTIDAVRPAPPALPWGRVRLVIVDVDGTLTPGTAYYSEQGEELKRFHTHDAHGLSMLRDAGVQVAVMTAESSGFPKAWAAKVGVERIRVGVRDKATAVRSMADELGVSLADVCVIGDDWSDVPAFRAVSSAGGLTAAVGNARPEVVALAAHRCRADGGHGAVREICDLLLAARSSATGGTNHKEMHP
jgi:N-acylneuraminate cytidylyltransferase